MPCRFTLLHSGRPNHALFAGRRHRDRERVAAGPERGAQVDDRVDLVDRPEILAVDADMGAARPDAAEVQVGTVGGAPTGRLRPRYRRLVARRAPAPSMSEILVDVIVDKTNHVQ